MSKDGVIASLVVALTITILLYMSARDDIKEDRKSTRLNSSHQ